MAKDDKMAEARAVAEAARDTKKHEGFIADLFKGRVSFQFLNPFPKQPPEDAAAGEEIIENFKKFLQNETNPDLIDAAGEIPDAVIEKLKKIGAFGAKIPKEYGGWGFSQSNYRRLAVLLGSWCSNLTALISAHNSLGATLPLMKYGTPEQREGFLARMAKGAISAFGLTEEGAGSDPACMKAYALRIRNVNGEVTGYRLNGKKLFTTNAVKDDYVPLAEVVVIIARIVDDPDEVDNASPKSPKRYGLFLVESNQDGYSIGRRCRFMGYRSIYNGEVCLKNVYVPMKNRVLAQQKPQEKETYEEWEKKNNGLRMALEILTIGRLTVPSACAGTLKQLLCQTRQYARERIQWGSSIGEHEQNSERLVRMACHTLVLDAMTQYCNLLIDQKKDARLASAAVKIIGTEYVAASLKDSFMILGGVGFETAYSKKARGKTPFPLERLMRDAPINEIFEGPNPVMRLWIAREGLDEYVKREPKSKFSLTAAKLLVWIGWQFTKNLALPGAWSHKKFIIKEAKRLVRDIIKVSFKYQQKLIRKQLITFNFVNRVLGIFEMAIALAYGAANRNKPLAKELVDYFCWSVRERPDFRRPRGFTSWAFWGHHKNLYKLARAIMAGEAQWLEEGIVPSSLTKNNMDECVRGE